MDDDGLNMRNWGYYEPSLKGHLGLQLMSSVAERNTKPFLSGRDHTVMVSTNGAFRAVSDAPVHMDYVRDSWVNQREKFLNMLPGNPNFGGVRKEGGPLKKRTAGSTPKAPKTKKTKKGPSVPKDNGNSSVQRAKPVKRNMDVVINGIDMDISGIPIPVCSCTGTPQQCYRWGCGGWQSACCTTIISVYPLPMSTKRRGARIAGRKMSQGAFKKVLEKLAAEGYNFSNPIDLRTHWAKHGTNKFVTIR
uniref:GAGA-binding transcriptional activator n=1 Tax=Davidia involucrata TaxID=16924 RepID=A0A5B6Z9Q2_DAVIN